MKLLHRQSSRIGWLLLLLVGIVVAGCAPNANAQLVSPQLGAQLHAEEAKQVVEAAPTPVPLTFAELTPEEVVAGLPDDFAAALAAADPGRGQTVAVLLSGLVLGSRLGAASQLLYLAAILSGLPLSAAGIGGPTAFVTPTAGYLLAFVPAAFVTGYIAERGEAQAPTLLRCGLASVCGMLVVYAGGVLWLSLYLGDLRVAAQQGALPFLGIDLAKAMVAALVARGGRLLLQPFLIQ